MYADIASNLTDPETGYIVRNKLPLFAGTALGMAATFALPRRQLAMLSNVGMGIEAASYATGNQTLSHWLTSSEGGARLINSIIPSSAEALRMTYDIFGDNTKWEHTKQDRSVKEYDPEDPGEAIFDITAKFMGFQTIDDYRNRMEDRILFREMQQLRAQKNAIMEEIVDRMYQDQLAFTDPVISSLIEEAAGENIRITSQEIYDYVVARRQDPDDRRAEQMARVLRSIELTIRGGNF
mgnify:FL=1